MGNTNDLDLVGAISYDWRDSVDTDKGLMITNKQPLTEMMAKYHIV